MIFSITNPKMPPTTTTNKGANGPAIVETESTILPQIVISDSTIDTG
jgi:hypothetical protein